MQIVVLIKAVPDSEARLRPDASGRVLDPDGVKFVLQGYDESAIEQALLLAEASPGSSVRAISAGPSARAEEVLRAALALGVGAATLVETPLPPAVDPLVIARALAYAIRKAPADLLIAGKQAGDDEEGIVGPAVAQLLGLPDLSNVVGVKALAGPGELEVHRAVEGGAELHRAALPLLIGLQQAANDPRTAKLPMILKSRKAPIDRIPWSELEPQVGSVRSRPVAFRLPPPRTGAKMVPLTTPEETAHRLVELLRTEAKVL